MVLKTYPLNQGIATDSTVSPSLGVEVSTLGAAIVHLASKEACENSADDENSPEHCNCQESVGETFHLEPNCSASAIRDRVEVAPALFEQAFANESRYYINDLVARLRIAATRLEKSVQVQGVAVHLSEQAQDSTSQFIHFESPQITGASSVYEPIIAGRPQI